MATDTATPARLPDGSVLVLRDPPTREVEPLILLPHLRNAARLAAVRPLLFRKSVASVNGVPPTMAQADRWAASAETTAALLPRVRALFEEGRQLGTVHAQCPACRTSEVEFTLTTLVSALGGGLPELFEGEWLAIPSLAQPLRRGRRPAGTALTSRLRALLPSSRRGAPGPLREAILADVEHEANRGAPGTAPFVPGPREAAAWARWAPHGVPRPPGQEHWGQEIPAFHAVLRVALAIDPDGLGDPALVERMPAIDFWFLDALYWLTHAVDVADATRVALRCGLCGAEFLPVR